MLHDRKWYIPSVWVALDRALLIRMSSLSSRCQSDSDSPSSSQPWFHSGYRILLHRDPQSRHPSHIDINKLFLQNHTPPIPTSSQFPLTSSSIILSVYKYIIQSCSPCCQTQCSDLHSFGLFLTELLLYLLGMPAVFHFQQEVFFHLFPYSRSLYCWMS